MLAAIRQVLDGGTYMSERLAASTRDHFDSTSPQSAHMTLQKLNDTEFEIFRLFGEGRTAKEIALQFQLSPKEVADHRDQIKEKLEFATSAEMIRQAVRWVAAQKLGNP